MSFKVGDRVRIKEKFKGRYDAPYEMVVTEIAATTLYGQDVNYRDRVWVLVECELVHAAPAPTSRDEIAAECDAIKALLLEKNAKYGDSALNPTRVFSRSDAVEQIRVRIDDKLSRLMRGTGVEDEDVVKDLIGYLVLLRIATRRAGEGANQ